MPRGNYKSIGRQSFAQRRVQSLQSGEEFVCFSSLQEWHAHVRKRYPAAQVKVENGVHRVFINKAKLAAFNANFGHGYVAGVLVSDYLRDHPHRNSKRKVSFAAFNGVLLRSSRKGVHHGA